MNDPKESIFVMKSEPLPPVSEEKSILPPYETPPHIKFYIPKSKFKRFYLPLIVFLLFIFSICIAPFVNISIAYISIFFIGFALILLSKNPVKVLDSLSVTDSLVFISALFMLSGILEYLGILKTAVDYIISFTGDNKVLIILCIILCAFIISTFLSAGPVAATILPVCIQLQPIIGSNIIFAALALGILAGSSMLPWSATGGSVMLNEVNRYINYYDISKEEEVKIRDVYNLKSYISFSVPFSFIILFFSIIYLVIYVSV